ncbi:MAG: hypothetical protein ABEK01_04445 [Candidatus Nanohaloarchaea archaeon]
MSQSSELERAYSYLEDRFGVRREELAPLELEKVSGDAWLTAPDGPEEAETHGIRCVRFTDIGLKPTTYALQLLDGRIERNRVRLDREEMLTLLEGGMVERRREEKGYVALMYRGRVVGCGLYKDELISSRIPKGRARELSSALKSREDKGL